MYKHKNAPLISPLADFLMIGGLSVLVIPFLFFIPLFETPTSLYYIGSLFFILSFVVNLPHFSASYQIFYGDHGDRIKRDWRWFMIGVAIPFVLIVFLAISYFTLDARNIGLVASLMFYTVGWHYVKQIFGCMIVTSSRDKYYFNAQQRLFLKTNLFSVAAMTITMKSDVPPNFVFHSVSYPFWMLPKSFAFIPQGVFWISFSILAYETFMRYKRTGEKPPLITYVPLAAIYMWFTPIMSNWAVGYTVPFFHSLQYLLFVFAYKRNEYRQTSAPQSWFGQNRMAVFCILAIVMGSLSMEIVPRVLDLAVTLNVTELTLCLAMFIAFINIHHYFMDFLMWRREIPEFNHYLLATVPTEPAAVIPKPVLDQKLSG